MKTLLIITITIALCVNSFTQQLLADNDVVDLNHYTSNYNLKTDIGISLSILPEFEPNTLSIEFKLENKGRWLIQLADTEDNVIYHQTGYGKGEYALDIKTRKITPGEYQLVVWSNDKYIIEKVVLNK